MKKIVIACRAYYPDVAGGGEISTRVLAEQLASVGYNVEVLAIGNETYTNVQNGIKINRIKYRNIYWSYNNKTISVMKKLIWHSLDCNNFLIGEMISNVLKEIKPDILITSTIEELSSIIWKVAKSQGIRVMHILRSYSLICVNANMFKKDNCEKICTTCKPFSILKKENSKYVDDVIGISEFILNVHLTYGYFKNARSHVIYNMCMDEILLERNYNGFRENKITIGYLGRIHKTKGIELIVEAVSGLSDSYKNNILIKIAGNGDEDYISELANLANAKNIKCSFEGVIPANQLLDQIDLLIVPSKWNEPFGRVVIESLGRRVPVAAKRVGGIPELLNDNEDFLFNTIEELTTIIMSYVNKSINFNFNLSRFENKRIINDWTKILGGLGA